LGPAARTSSSELSVAPELKYSRDSSGSGFMVLSPGCHPAGQTSPCSAYYGRKEGGRKEEEEEGV